MAPRVVIETEWLGFEGDVYHEPKSFGELNASDQALACEGLLQLLAAGSSFLSGVKTTTETSIDNKHLFFETLILASAIERLASKINLFGKPAYLSKTEKRTAIRGRIDFPRTVLATAGLQDKHVCNFAELSFEDEVLQFSKFAASFALSRTMGRYAGSVAKLIKPHIALINSILPQTSEPRDPLSTATKLVYSPDRLNQKYRELFPECRILAHFVISSALGMTSEESLRKTSGLIVNMNRPFEKLILLALESTGQFHHQPAEEMPLNKVEFLDANGTRTHAFTMKPDCKGWLNLDGAKYYFIGDAKHKLMSQDLDQDGDEKKDGLNRNDFYQIISYSSTHSQTSSAGFYCLIGLNEEKAQSDSWVKALPKVRISFGEKTLEVNRFALNFGSILVAIGESVRTNRDIDACLKKLGNELLQCFSSSTTAQ